LRGGPAAAGQGVSGHAASPGETQVLTVLGELDLVTADSLYLRARAAVGRHARLVLLDLAGVSFCDARGLGALVRIANDADATGCGFGLISPQPNVARILRVTGLNTRLRVFASIHQIHVDRHLEGSAGHPLSGSA
jgi:anti-sigma B factor antagonist